MTQTGNDADSPLFTRLPDATAALAAERKLQGLAMIHNCLLSIDGDEARGVCGIELRIWGSTQIMASGYYQDRLRRENGRWKFLERDCTFSHWGPQQPG